MHFVKVWSGLHFNRAAQRPGVRRLFALAWILLPFASLVALSRIILGLHYPTDVLAGAAIGATLALLSLPIADVM